MTSQIPFSQVVSVVPGVLSAGGLAVDLTSVLLSQNAMAPYGTPLSFASASAVGTYFGTSSTEYAIAAIYFAGYQGASKFPGSMQIARYPETAIAGFLSSNLSAANSTLAAVQAMGSGTLILTVGGTQYTSGTINLASATSLSNAASLIQAAFTSPPFSVAFNTTSNQFVFTTTATGATATITYCTGTLSTLLCFTAATGAVLSQGAAAAVPATFMNTLLTQTQNWATFMTAWESILTEKQAFAAWSSSVAPRYLYVCQDSDVNALTANNTVTFGNYLQQNTMAGTCAVYGNYTHAAFVCGFAASLNFTALNGRATLNFKSQSGLSAYVTSQTNYQAVISNGYNTYAAFGSNNPANNANWMSPGSVSGIWLWADTYLNQIWLNANLQLAIVNMLTSVGSVPYNSQGNGLIYAACSGVLSSAVNFGAIRKGITLTASQIAQIQSVLGFDASSAITNSGFYLFIGQASGTTRQARQSPPMTLFYQDGESVQQINLSSIVVQ